MSRKLLSLDSLVSQALTVINDSEIQLAKSIAGYEVHIIVDPNGLARSNEELTKALTEVAPLYSSGRDFGTDLVEVERAYSSCSDLPTLVRSAGNYRIRNMSRPPLRKRR